MNNTTRPATAEVAAAQSASTSTPSVLRPLRALVPLRAVRFSEALRVAEFQATRLVGLLNCDETGILDHHLADLPRIQIGYDAIPVSALIHRLGGAA